MVKARACYLNLKKWLLFDILKYLGISLRTPLQDINLSVWIKQTRQATELEIYSVCFYQTDMLRTQKSVLTFLPGKINTSKLQIATIFFQIEIKSCNFHLQSPVSKTIKMTCRLMGLYVRNCDRSNPPFSNILHNLGTHQKCIILLK